MKKLRWQLLVVVLALIAIGVLLYSQQQVSLPGINPVDEPVAGGLYSEALIGSLGRLNPVLDYYNPVDSDVDRLLFSSLVRFDHRGLPHFDLAQDLGVSQDGEVYNFLIRRDAVWHDGEPVTSADVIFTVNLLKDESVPLPADIKEFWESVNVEALDEKTLYFRLPEPFSPFMDYLTFGVLPEHILGNMTAEEIIDAPFNLNPVGSGPYQFESLEVEEGQIKGVVLRSFDDYYLDKAYIEKIEFQYYSDVASAVSAYENGDVMGISEITLDVLPEALREENLHLFTGRLPSMGIVFLNLDNPEAPFFQEVAVRQALLMGINRRWIVDRLLGGQAIIANGPIFPESWAYYEGVEQVPFDPEAAVKQLKEAGYTIPAEGGRVRSKDGVSLSFDMVYPDNDLYTGIAEHIRGDWERIGVEARLIPVPYEELLEDYLEPRTYHAALVELNLGRTPDPDPYPFWHQAQITGGQNYAQWDDRQVSEYLEQGRVIFDVNGRAQRYRNFQVRFAAELPSLPLFFPVYSYGVDQQVQGVSMGPLYDRSDRFNNLTSWYIITGPAAQALITPTGAPEN